MRPPEFLRRFRRPSQNAPHELPQGPARYSEIGRIATDAAQIWFDNKGDKVGRYKKAADRLFGELDLKTLEDSGFYHHAGREAHTRALQLLSLYVPKKSEDLPSFMNSEANRKIVVYVRGLVENRPRVSNLGH